MTKKNLWCLTLSAFVLYAGMLNHASAREAVKCEKRLSPSRSSVSVNFEGLQPSTAYVIQISSGTNVVRPVIASDNFGALRVEADSNPKDIRAGDFPIASTFIINDVNVGVYENGTLVTEGGANCIVR
ncbi:MAG: hypothetical protein ACR65R_12600 [Methylomicrobium sp.]